MKIFRIQIILVIFLFSLVGFASEKATATSKAAGSTVDKTASIKKAKAAVDEQAMKLIEQAIRASQIAHVAHINKMYVSQIEQQKALMAINKKMYPGMPPDQGTVLNNDRLKQEATFKENQKKSDEQFYGVTLPGISKPFNDKVEKLYQDFFAANNPAPAGQATSNPAPSPEQKK